MSDAAKSAAAQTKPFDMMIQGAGCFPPRGRVRVIWAGVASPIESVIACFDALEAALEERGFDREARPFSPHITLGRVADDRSNGRLRRTVMSYGIGVSRGIEVSHGIGPLVQSIGSLAVMQSQLSLSGAIHTPVSTHEFVTHEL